MPSVRIIQFAGLLPEVSPKLLQKDHAQMAHNCLLWDGWLRAMPAWESVVSVSGTVMSLFPAADASNQFSYSTTLIDGQLAGSEPLIQGSLWGINPQNYTLGYNQSYTVGSLVNIPIKQPAATINSQTISPQFLSTSPNPRTYAITYVTELGSGYMESPPLVFPGIGANGTLFEGDIVTLNFTLTNADPTTNVGYIRLYRDVVGFDTGASVGNPRETVFHLVTLLVINPNNPNIIYVDELSSDFLLGDRLLTETFGPLLVQQPLFVGQTDSGWLVAAGPDTNYTNRSLIHVSERYQWHAWPLANLVAIPDILTDAATFYDEVFIGTKARPYHMRITQNQNPEGDTIDVNIRPFPDYYGCVEGTMVTTNSGAMYASPDGLIALEVNEDQIATRRVANPGDTLINPITPIKIEDTLNSAWWNGLFVGFCAGVGYVFNQENSHSSQFPLGQLVTFSPPAGVQGPSTVTGIKQGGLIAAFGNEIYRWPLPGYGYESASLLNYQWQSKTFVMAGTTTFAGAKVVGDTDGYVIFNFYGDGVLIYSFNVPDSTPFRIPHNHSVLDVVIELIGTRTIQEVHLATSMRELTETEGTNYA